MSFLSEDLSIEEINHHFRLFSRKRWQEKYQLLRFHLHKILDTSDKLA